MTPTPERALELANFIAGPFDLCGDEEKEIATILRAYAEILPKWQAALDAEPDAYRYSMIGEGQLIGRCFEEEPEAAPFGAPGIHYDSEYVVEEVPLIIKPAP